MQGDGEINALFSGSKGAQTPWGGLIGGLLRPQFRRCLKDATDGACFVSMSYCTKFPAESCIFCTQNPNNQIYRKNQINPV